jgi:hypothetical protein
MVQVSVKKVVTLLDPEVMTELVLRAVLTVAEENK